MLYLISGATAAGKSSVSRAVAARLPDLVPFEEDRRRAPTTEERRTNLELWIEDALDLEAAGKDVVFVFDSSETDFAGTVVAIADWIESVRRSAPPLTRDDEWWSERRRAKPSP